MGKAHSESYLGFANLEYSFAGNTFVPENVKNKHIPPGFLKFIQKKAAEQKAAGAKRQIILAGNASFETHFPAFFKLDSYGII